MVTRTFWSGCALAALLLLTGIPTQAQEFTEQAKKRIEMRSYVAFFGSSCNIRSDGDFKGTYDLDPPGTGDQTHVPSLERNLGGGALVGHRIGEYAAEVSYWHSQHVVNWTDTVTVFQSNATYHAINLDLKRYLFPRKSLQPFLLAGFSVPWLVVREASVAQPLDPLVNPTSAVFSGFGFNLGIGAEYFLNDRFSVFAGAVQRWAQFGKVKGYSRTTVDVQDIAGNSYNLKGDGMNVLAGATISFL